MLQNAQTLVASLHNGNTDSTIISGDTDENIQHEIYAISRQLQLTDVMTFVSRFLQALTLLRVATFYDAEIPLRIASLSSGSGNPHVRAVSSIKIDFAAADSGRTREEIKALKGTNREEYVRLYTIVYLR
jgi:capsid portal protein